MLICMSRDTTWITARVGKALVMATVIRPLRRMWNFGVNDIADRTVKLPVLTLEPGDTFESNVTNVEGMTENNSGAGQPWGAYQTVLMLKWSFSEPSGTPAAPGAVPDGSDTPEYVYTKFQDAVTSAGNTWYIFDRFGTSINRYLDGQRGTLWFIFTHDFPVGDELEAWFIEINFRCYYRAPSVRNPV